LVKKSNKERMCGRCGHPTMYHYEVVRGGVHVLECGKCQCASVVVVTNAASTTE